MKTVEIQFAIRNFDNPSLDDLNCISFNYSKYCGNKHYDYSLLIDMLIGIILNTNKKINSIHIENIRTDKLPSLPDTIQEIWIENAGLTHIPIPQGKGINMLRVMGNKLTRLPSNYINYDFIYVERNQLTCIKGKFAHSSTIKSIPFYYPRYIGLCSGNPIPKFGMRVHRVGSQCVLSIPLKNKERLKLWNINFLFFFGITYRRLFCRNFLE